MLHHQSLCQLDFGIVYQRGVCMRCELWRGILHAKYSSFCWEIILGGQLLGGDEPYLQPPNRTE